MTYKKYDKYKDSGVVWIDKIPCNWELKRMKDVKDNNHPYPIGDGDHGQISPNDYIESGIPYIRVQNLGWGTPLLLEDVVYISEKVHRLNKKSTLYPGDILVAKTGATFGKVGIIPDDIKEANTTSSVGKVTISKKYFNKYFFYVLESNSCYSQMSNIAYQKSAQPGFNIEDLFNFYLPLPSTEEQKAIANYLDERMVNIDKRINLLQQKSEKYKSLRKNLINHVITKGLNPNVKMKNSGIIWLGEIPEHWEIKKIKDVAKLINGDRTSNYPSGDDIKDEGIIFITSNNLHDFVMDVSKNISKYITSEKYKSLGGAKIKLNDIIFCLRGSIGLSSINLTENEGTIASSLVNIRPYRITPKYLNYLLNSNIIKYQTQVYMNGSCAANLSAENVSNYIISIPKREEQKDIIEYLDDKTSQIDKILVKIDEEVEKLQQLRNVLINDAVTGKIKVI